ncbi:hypothetical protein [Candidatus Berkiella aquae]|uniref:Uncharacterized protein n=1 Tax=Candidatus Berkiella aquae TaxID=295108 RepID=A0A0Q9YR00_9GAMM|nr:hypothetical protein [Candidatus Berkiella aquae]MCS5712897.1 hypothetical protein [Candidatus Berkiella aquae]
MWHKKRASSLVALGIAVLLISENAISSHVTYSLEYSTAKKPAFENTEINAQLFRGGVPAGYFKIKPNSRNEFTVPNDSGSNIAIAAFSVKGQDKLHLACSGNAFPGKQKIVMECIPK